MLSLFYRWWSFSLEFKWFALGQISRKWGKCVSNLGLPRFKIFIPKNNLVCQWKAKNGVIKTVLNYKLCIPSRNEVTNKTQYLFSMIFRFQTVNTLGSVSYSYSPMAGASHWMTSKVNLPYTKFLPIKKRVKVKLEWASTYFYTGENCVIFIFYV